MRQARTSFTVKQLSDLAGVSIRTLHYYDEIGLLHPESHGENGYRYYGKADLLKLQQVLFFRELDFPLSEIKVILDRPDFNLLHALRVHRATLQQRVERLEQLIRTLDKTVEHLEGGTPMADQDYYQGFNEAKQKEYEAYIHERYGDEPLNTSVQRWGSLSPAEKKAFLERGNRLHQDIAAAMDKGYDSPEIQALMARFRQHYSFFYDISVERFEALGHMYNQNPEFQANFESVRPGLAAFLEQAISYYVAHTKE